MERFRPDYYQGTGTLHTDILERIYGPIHAVVLRHDNVGEIKKGSERIREARLVDDANILRTYALTFLTYDDGNREIVDIDDEIRQGGLIGQTFRKYGYVIKKNVIDVFIMTISSKMSYDFNVGTNKAKARVTEFYAKKMSGSPIMYGTILEIYSPDFENPDGGITEVDRNQVNPMKGALQSVGVTIDEIWERLDHAAEDNTWDDLQEKYEEARQLSQPAVQSFHQKISQYLGKSHGKK